MNSGDRVNALYLAKRQGTSLAMGRRVLTVTPREDGQVRITVDLPSDAALEYGTYLVGASGESDYISTARGFVVSCGGCGAEIWVTDDDWADRTLKFRACLDCPDGVDLDHARRHADVG
jgi:hypothetical protein